MTTDWKGYKHWLAFNGTEEHLKSLIESNLFEQVYKNSRKRIYYHMSEDPNLKLQIPNDDLLSNIHPLFISVSKEFVINFYKDFRHSKGIGYLYTIRFDRQMNFFNPDHDDLEKVFGKRLAKDMNNSLIKGDTWRQNVSDFKRIEQQRYLKKIYKLGYDGFLTSGFVKRTGWELESKGAFNGAENIGLFINKKTVPYIFLLGPQKIDIENYQFISNKIMQDYEKAKQLKKRFKDLSIRDILKSKYFYSDEEIQKYLGYEELDYS